MIHWPSYFINLISLLFKWHAFLHSYVLARINEQLIIYLVILGPLVSIVQAFCLFHHLLSHSFTLCSHSVIDFLIINSFVVTSLIWSFDHNMLNCLLNYVVTKTKCFEAPKKVSPPPPSHHYYQFANNNVWNLAQRAVSLLHVVYVQDTHG